MKVTSLSWSVHCCWARQCCTRLCSHSFSFSLLVMNTILCPCFLRSRTPGRMLMFTGLLLNHFGLFEARYVYVCHLDTSLVSLFVYSANLVLSELSCLEHYLCMYHSLVWCFEKHGHRILRSAFYLLFIGFLLVILPANFL